MPMRQQSSKAYARRLNNTKEDNWRHRSQKRESTYPNLSDRAWAAWLLFTTTSSGQGLRLPILCCLWTDWVGFDSVNKQCNELLL